MTMTSTPQAEQTPDRASQTTGAPARRTGRWIDDWRPEEPEFWAETGQQVARRNLIWSIFAEHLGFSVWLIWSVSSAFLLSVGFEYSAQQLFVLVALPNLVGSLLRLPYTLAVPKFGGRNWTMVSAALLLVPTLGFAYAVQNPQTPFWVFCLIAATAGLGGGNFASSMANINFFYPSAKKGAALGLNAAGGNLGVSLIQFFLPVIVGGGASSAWSRRARAASTSSAPRGSTPASRSSPRWRRTSSWTTSAPRSPSPASSCRSSRSARPGSWRSSTSAPSARSSATPRPCRC
jgi:NNP family nitrate/nitrite transporter-like MFS transporter